MDNIEKNVNFYQVRDDECKIELKNGSPCKETNTLDILYKFNQTYKDRLDEIDRLAGDDIELKYPIYREWTGKLLSQNNDLIEAVEQLESEACHLLKARLHRNPYRNRLDDLESDVRNLLELIRRLRENQVWSDENLNFRTISHEQIFGAASVAGDNANLTNNVMSIRVSVNPDCKVDTAVVEKEFSNNLNDVSTGNKHHFTDKQIRTDTTIETDKFRPDHNNKMYYDEEAQTINLQHSSLLQELRKVNGEREAELKAIKDKNAELETTISEMNQKLFKIEQEKQLIEKSALDARVLVFEVAEKHDANLKCRNEIIKLEEQLKQKDTHIHFKEEIIKELRRKFKKLPQSTNDLKRSNSCKENASDGMACKSSESEKIDDLQENIDIKQSEIDQYLAQLRAKEEQIQELELYFEYIKDTFNIENLSSFKQMLNNQLENNENSISKIEPDYVLKIIQNTSSILDSFNESLLVKETSILDSKFKDIAVGIRDIFSNVNTELLTLRNENVRLNNLVLHTEQELLTEQMGHEINRLTSNSFSNESFVTTIDCYSSGYTSLQDDSLSAKQTASTVFLQDVAVRFCEIFGKQMTDDSMNTISRGDCNPLTNLMNDLQKEIELKERLIKDKDELLLEREENEKNLVRKIVDSNNRYTSLSNERNANLDIITNLKEAVSLHLQTIRQLQSTNNELIKQFDELQHSITSNDNNKLNLMERNRKLEIECKHQIITISNLRTALEESSKRSTTAGTTTAPSLASVSSYNSASSSAITTATSPNPSTANSNTHNTSMWSWWRNVHDV